MIIQHNQQNLNKSQQSPISEIGQILAHAIIRLEQKTHHKILDKELDSKFYPSVHEESDNKNQGV